MAMSATGNFYGNLGSSSLRTPAVNGGSRRSLNDSTLKEITTLLNDQTKFITDSLQEHSRIVTGVKTDVGELKKELTELKAKFDDESRRAASQLRKGGRKKLPKELSVSQ